MTPAAVRMSPEEFRAFQNLLRDHAGVVIEDAGATRLERRLGERRLATGARDFADYFFKVSRRDAKGREELQRMLEACVTHETYFFREPRQLMALEREVLPALALELEKRGGPRRLRAWSAGCSTGEEAYTLAMLLLRSPFLHGFALEVLGTDLSQAALARARAGVYGSGSFRGTDTGPVSRYFLPKAGAANQQQVSPEVKKVVTFGVLNLWDPSQAGMVARMDLIMCRNVLIYFDRPGKLRVLGHLHDALRPGGWLLLGHSENLLNLPTRLEAVSLAHDLVYRRGAAA